MAASKVAKAGDTKSQKKEQARPEVIERFREHRKLANFHEKEEKALRPEVLPILRVSNYTDTYISVSSTDTVNEEKALEWAKNNLSPDKYKSLFVRIFDPNKFTNLIQEGIVKRDDLPDGVINTVKQEKIYVK